MPKGVTINVEAVTSAAQSALESFRRSTEEKFVEFGKALTAAFAVDRLIEFTKRAVEGQAEMGRFAQKVGVGVEALSGLSASARQYNVSQQELQIGLRQLSLQLTDLQRGGEEAERTFQQLGLVNVHFDNLDQALRAIADRFHVLPDGIEKTEVAIRLFGRAGENLIPFLNQGSAAFDDLGKKAEHMGLLVSEHAAKAAEELEQNIFQLKANADGFADALAQKLVPGLVAFTGQLNESATAAEKSNSVVEGLAVVFRSLLTGVTAVYYSLKILAELISGVLLSVFLLLENNINNLISVWRRLTEQVDQFRQSLVLALRGLADFAQASVAITSGNIVGAVGLAKRAVAELDDASMGGLDGLAQAFKSIFSDVKGNAQSTTDDLRAVWKKALSDIGLDLDAYMAKFDALWNKAPTAHAAPAPGAARGVPTAGPTGFVNPPILQEAQQAQNFQNNLNLLKQYQQIVSSDPFKSEIEKRNQLVPLLKTENALLQEQIETLRKIEQDETRTDAQRLDARTKEVALLGQQADVRIKIRELESNDSFVSTMQRGLADLTTAWGNLGSNLAHGVIDSITNSVQGLGQAIVDVIAGTRTWGQVFAQIGRQIIATILQILINWILSITLIAALRKIFNAGATAEAQGMAAAWAPAAVSASIASYGGAAIAGTAAFIAAMGTGVGAAVGFAAAGYAGGGLTPGQPTLIQVGEKGPEFVVTAPTVRKYGTNFFRGLESGAGIDFRALAAAGDQLTPRVNYDTLANGSSGPVNVSPAPVHVAVLSTEEEVRRFMESHAGEQIVTAHVGRNKNKLGIRS